MRRVTRPALCGLIMALALAGGCEDNNISAPVIPAGRIRGQVTCGGLPVDGTITVVAVDLPDGQEATFSTDVEPDGSFGLDVPEGRYVVQFNTSTGNATYDYTSAGPGVGLVPPDTLVVDTWHAWPHVDFPLAGLTVEISLPDSLLDGQTCHVYLHRSGFEDENYSPRYLWRGSAKYDDTTCRVEMPGVLPGRYRIELGLGTSSYDNFSGDGEHLWLPGVSDPDQAAWYDIPVGERTSLEYASSTPPAHMAGHIGGAWLELYPSNKPKLSVINTDSVTILGGTLYGEGGSFALDIYQTQPVKLMISQAGLSQCIGGPDFASATIYDLVPGQIIGDIEVATCAITLEPSIPLTDLYSNPPFEIYDPDDLTLLGTVDTHLYLNSAYILSNLWPGEFLLRIAPYPYEVGSIPWIPQWYEGTTDPTEADRITITEPGEILPLSMTMLTGGEIHGRIVASEPSTDSYMILFTPADADTLWGRNYIWFPDTEFSGVGLPDGQYKVGATPIGLLLLKAETPDNTIWYPGTSDWNAAGVVTIENAGTVVGVDIPVD